MNRQVWSGKFFFADLWGGYVGPSSDNSSHAHAAVQVCLGIEGDVSVELERARAISGPVLIVGPLVRHRLLPSPASVMLIYIEALSPLAARLLEAIRPKMAGAPPQGMGLSLREDEAAESWVARVADSFGAIRDLPDPRIGAALRNAARDGAPGAVGRAAKAAGLSQARLRALAKSQLGVPVSQLLLWRKLQGASRAMAEGATLAAAAAAGGFTDQAHMTRTMRRMFGITPSSARTPLMHS